MAMKKWVLILLLVCGRIAGVAASEPPQCIFQYYSALFVFND